jgi:hypothetical protein
VKTFALLLCLIATTADAAPLYLKCDGEEHTVGDRSTATQVTYSIKIDGTNVWFEGGDPFPILSDDGDVLTFGSETRASDVYGTINRITGHVEITFSLKLKKGQIYDWKFEGVCHKTEKLF